MAQTTGAAARQDADGAARADAEVPGGADAGALDAMLADAALGPLRRLLPGTAAVTTAVKLATRPRTLVHRSATLGREAARITLGRSAVEPSPKDRRFADPAWTGNPLLHRVLQSYLVAAGTLDRLVDDANLDWRSERRMRWVTENLAAALAPSNHPLLNPAALKAALDTGGRNYVRGARALVHDLAHRPRIPSMVEPDAFTVGEDLAVTDGAVVLRTPLVELLQYRPRAEAVREVPVLVVPPMINKYYVADLAPGRSMVEHFLDSGLQVFAMSWRNPGPEHAEWGLDDYVGAVLDSLDAVERVTGSSATSLFALCAGGIVSTVTCAHLAATGALDRVRSLTLAVTVLDQERAGTVGSLVDPNVAALAAEESARRGYLDGRALAGVFAWLRPNDLVWSYWVNNYLLGKPPPAFDVLFWNADTTRMPARLHRDFLDLAVGNRLVHGGVRVRGTDLDLSRVTVDSYNLAGVADHICPWENVYRSGRLLGRRPRFVLSTNGHIAALVNPPGNPKSTYRLNPATPDDPEEWLAGATTHSGSWWPDWTAWVAERSGDLVDPPAALGADDLPPLDPAPGTYVRQR